VRYESLVVDLQAQVRPLLAFLGLPWDEAVLNYRKTALARERIATPSYAQVTEELYTRAAERWRRYRSRMQPVLPLLAPWVERFSYSLD
jgi:hypothetical protein